LLVGFLVIKGDAVADCEAAGVPRAQRRWFAVLLGQGSEFAFVVFGAAQMADVLDGEWAKALTWRWRCRWRQRRSCWCC
jgi:glutathione-regulated potassium-efflux system ancillary protein KefC